MNRNIPGYLEGNGNRRLDKVTAITRNNNHRTLMDPNATQEEKLEALENLDADRRLKTARSQAHTYTRNGFYNRLPGPDELPSLEDDMSRETTNYQGHQVFSAGYQKFTDATVETDPVAYYRTHNVTNHGYPSETGDTAKKYARIRSASEILKAQMKPNDASFVQNVVKSLKEQHNKNNLPMQTLFERFERSNNSHKQNHLYLIAHELNVIKEQFDDTSGQWVVVMPWASPTTPDQILYNQRGLSTVPYKELEKKQQGNYWVDAEQTIKRRAARQVPPAKENGEGSQVPYYSQDPKSKRSLKNPKRGDDYIRAARLKMEHIVNLESQAQSLVEDISRENRSWIVEKLTKKLKFVRNAIESQKGQLKMMQKNKRKADAEQGMASNTAQAVSDMYVKKDASHELAQEQAAYRRHLSLLSEATNILSQQQTFLNIPRSREDNNNLRRF